ncbi:hypothetical protein L0F63_000516 [Massospora cicadina]|nr:hypothetical protein L0F63_000516 [Massospora cicadina]
MGWSLPSFVLTDSYKLSHGTLYPPSQIMSAYGAFRAPFNRDPYDERILFYGIRFITEEYLNRRWTLEELAMSEKFFATHNKNFTPFPFDGSLFKKFITENNGYFPVTLRALPEGTTVYPNTPVFTITAEEPYAGLVTYLESLLSLVWYPTTVATLSRRCRDIIQRAFDASVELGADRVADKLRDFGLRGFEGSSTLPAAYFVQNRWNNGNPVATCIPGTEHSVMTSHSTELDAMVRLVEEYGAGTYACVMDSYDYAHALASLLPQIATLKLERGGVLILRPDSGDPVETVLMALDAADKVFGSTVNQKGYKVLKGCGVVQGDGVDIVIIERVLGAVLKAGYSAQNVTFGMGGALLQRVDRDTLSFATKLSYRMGMDGTHHPIYKDPKANPEKASLPGQLQVKLDPVHQLPCVYPRPHGAFNSDPNDLLRIIYDKGPVDSPFETFEAVRERADHNWERSPLTSIPSPRSLKPCAKDAGAYVIQANPPFT